MKHDPLMLIDAYLDGRLPAEQARVLCQWIKASSVNATLFVDKCYLHSRIYDILRWQDIDQSRQQIMIDAIFQGSQDVDSQEKFMSLVAALDDTRNEAKLVEVTEEQYAALQARYATGRGDNATDQDTPRPTTHAPNAAAAHHRPRRIFDFAGIRLYTGVEREETAYGFKPRYLAYAALFLAVIIFATMQLWPKGEEEQVVQEETPPPVAHVEPETQDPRPEPRPIIATIGRTIAADWDQGVTLESDLRLHEGSSFTLTEGFIELVMRRGARVVLEAPCVVELIDDNRLRLDRGRLVAHVSPQATGFTVDAPGTRVVDHGTEFGMFVDEEGKAEVHVFEGAVSAVLVRPDGSPIMLRNLRERNAAVLTPNDLRIETASLDPVAFIRSTEPQEIAEKSHERQVRIKAREAYHRWLAYSMELRRDPSVMVYYSFEEGWTSTDPLVNVAMATGDGLHGTLGDVNRSSNHAAPRWTQGRFPQKRALDFDGQYSQVVVVPHDERLNPSGSITIAAWFRGVNLASSGPVVNKFESPQAVSYEFGLLAPARGEVGRRMQFVVNHVTGVMDDPRSNPLTLNHDGTWEHLAVTFDGATVRFYHNGRPAGRVDHALPLIPCDADLFIGRHAPGNPTSGVFNGMLDELILLSRVMNEDEIQQMYQAGVPAGNSVDVQ